MQPKNPESFTTHEFTWDMTRARYALGLITERDLGDMLALKFGGSVTDLLSMVLLKPLGDLVTRPGKKIRGRLVQVGFQLACPQFGQTDEHLCRRLMEAVEHLHAGSLAVDDVQDGSK